MFLNYYKLAEQPFGVTPDSRFLYLGAKHREALASLAYGTESNRGFLALIAKPGMGKTSLLYHYLEFLRDRARTAFVFRTDCNSREFIRHVLLDLGVDVAGMDLPEMHDRFNRLLTEEMNAGRRFVLVIDEAQNLEEKVLESVRLLSNFETPWMKLMQIVLAGQPQLADRLASASMAQLRQRISMVIRIEPFTPQEVNTYIDHRLKVSGCEDASLFTVGARKLIAEHSEGIPRNINNLCFNALSLGCALRRKTIDRDLIAEVIADLDLEPLREKAAQGPRERAELAAPAPVLALSTADAKRSFLNRWIPRLAMASGVLLALILFVAQAGQRELRQAGASENPTTGSSAPAAAISAPAAATAPVASAAETVPAIAGAASASGAIQAPQAVQVMAGQTLYQISTEKLGKYDGEVLEKLRGLNPWLSDPNLIRTGQKLRIPAAAAKIADPQRAGEQASNAAPAEVEKR